RLADRGFMVVGLDVSREALACAPDAIRAVAGSAEEMPFAENSFDLVIYIASLQFIENYSAAIKRTAHVLKPGGRLIAMLLNPASEFFKAKYTDPDSYVRKLKHTDLQALEICIAEQFETRGEYCMGVQGDKLFDSTDPATAALYIINGIKKGRADYA
ncbi:class I SAM-dependent methyltransferase, partial [bacterium]|nr:class I SAM-dependent methyltransferase [bacterium]